MKRRIFSYNDTPRETLTLKEEAINSDNTLSINYLNILLKSFFNTNDKRLFGRFSEPLCRKRLNSRIFNYY